MSAFGDFQNKAVSWEVELTSRCNSRCVGCSRYSEYYYPHPYFNPHVDLKKEILFKALQSTPHLEFILFCGNYGDPLLHPEIFEILEFIRREKGNLRVLVHSNAAFGNSEFWQKLAGYFQTPGSYIKFSLDGLKNSHEKFRRGTQWEKALGNARSFIAAGGRAVWKMIEFEHNRHEIPEARALAARMGFHKFDLRKNNYPGLDAPILREVELSPVPASVTASARSPEQLEQWNENQVREKKFDHIECRSVLNKNIFLDAYGQVWPCCWVGGLPYRPEHELRQWFQNKVQARYEKDFNSLERRSLEEILRQAWFQNDLESSWANKARDPLNPLPSTCAKTCGKCAT
jgi:MoaA/NifB/PqqE/SkfB family radical SAM enzyme